MLRTKRGLSGDGFSGDPSLQKRQRLPQCAGLALHPHNENTTHLGLELGDNRRKRSRGSFGEECGAGYADQRVQHMQQVVQQRDDEVAKLRQMLAQREAELADKRRLMEAAVAHCSELNAAKESAARAAQDALAQNKILKRGVAIQVCARFVHSSSLLSEHCSQRDPSPLLLLPTNSKQNWRRVKRRSRRSSIETLR